jgi:hypothetical protein
MRAEWIIEEMYFPSFSVLNPHNSLLLSGALYLSVFEQPASRISFESSMLDGFLRSPLGKRALGYLRL